MEWAQLVMECRNSELSCKEWCAQRGITERKYYYWQKHIFDLAIVQREAVISTSPKDCEAHFAELPAPQPSSNLIASIQAGQVFINLYSGADLEMAQVLLRALKEC
jgi:hypothetical protein